jgi:hypothetical protein
MTSYLASRLRWVSTLPRVPRLPVVALSIKKSLIVLPVQLGMHVPNVYAHVSKAPDIRVIIDL